MRTLIAVDSFKGTLTAAAAAAAIGRGLRAAAPDTDLDLCPLADGGEGTAEVLHAALGGTWISAKVTAPLHGDHTEARYLRTAAQRPSAIIDLAAASGVTLLPMERLDPLHATTLGTGELIRHALDRGAHRVWLALGGSATVDGGVGMAMALGWRFLDASGDSVGVGGGVLERIARIVPPPDLLRARVIALRDVDNPLLGERGAARVFGPQKGATPAMVERLERGLARLADLVERDLGIDLRRLVGGGSAGGAAAGAVAFLGARLVPGARLVLRVVRFDERVREADWVITGEGRLDSQSLDGKVVSAVARAAGLRGVPVAAIAGRVTLDRALAAAHGIQEVEAAASNDVPDGEAMARAESLLEAAAARLVTRLSTRSV